MTNAEPGPHHNAVTMAWKTLHPPTPKGEGGALKRGTEKISRLRMSGRRHGTWIRERNCSACYCLAAPWRRRSPAQKGLRLRKGPSASCSREIHEEQEAWPLNVNARKLGEWCRKWQGGGSSSAENEKHLGGFETSCFEGLSHAGEHDHLRFLPGSVHVDLRGLGFDGCSSTSQFCKRHM